MCDEKTTKQHFVDELEALLRDVYLNYFDTNISDKYFLDHLENELKGFLDAIKDANEKK